MTDIFVADAAVYEKVIPADSLKTQAQKYYLMVLAKHHVSKELFVKSLKFYTRRPDIFDHILAPIIDSLNTMEGGTHKGK